MFNSLVIELYINIQKTLLLSSYRTVSVIITDIANNFSTIIELGGIIVTAMVGKVIIIIIAVTRLPLLWPVQRHASGILATNIYVRYPFVGTSPLAQKKKK